MVGLWSCGWCYGGMAVAYRYKDYCYSVEGTMNVFVCVGGGDLEVGGRCGECCGVRREQ